MRFIRAISIVLVAVLAASCAPNWRNEMQTRLDREPWTKEQKGVAREYGYLYFTTEKEDGTRVVLYSRLSTRLVRTQIESLMADVDAVLSYQNRGANQYLQWTGRREYFEHQEKVFQAIYTRVRLLELYSEFQKSVGTQSGSSSHHRDEYGVDHRDGYDPSILSLSPDELSREFPFSSEFLDEAKDAGLLQQIGEYSVAEERQYAFKEPDPDAPDDPQKFIWRTRAYRVVVLTYKVLDAGNGKPRNNYANYAEVYRVFEGVREPLPAIRAFFNGQGGSSVAVIDLQREGEIGYGMPDNIERLMEDQLASDGMIRRIHERPKAEKNERIEPKMPPITVEIARRGEPVDVWERCEGGCEVPFEYQNDDRNNFSVDLHFQEKKSGESGNTKSLDYIEKHWRALQPGAGEVVEYYVPQEPFNQPALDVRGTSRGSGMYKLEIVYPDGTEESAVITPTSAKAIGPKPKAIGYNWLEKRWVIEDTDDDGTFDRKREVADLRGGYSSSGRFNDLGNN